MTRKDVTYIALLWLFLCACLVVLGFLIRAAHGAETGPDVAPGTITLEYCKTRADLTLKIASDMESGLDTDHINLWWPTGRGDEKEDRVRDKWVQDLKDEINAEAKLIPRSTPDWAQRIAQKVIERCWQSYGRDRGKSSFSDTASSEHIGSRKHSDLELQCEYRRQLAVYVVDVSRAAMTQEEFWVKYPTPSEWSQAQKATAVKVVNDAYEWKGTPFEYGDQVRDQCLKE